jgi:hypothetical protein
LGKLINGRRGRLGSTGLSSGFGIKLVFEAGLDTGVFFTAGAAFFRGFLADFTGDLAFAKPLAGFFAILDTVFPAVFFATVL